MHAQCKAWYWDCMSSASSVRLSVCDVGGSGSHKLKVLETNCTTISPTPLIFVAQRPSTSHGNRGNFGETRGGVEKSGLLEHKRSFERYHPRPPTAFSSKLRLGVRNPNPKLQSLLSQEQVKLRTANLADTFTASISTKAHKKFGRKESADVSRCDEQRFSKFRYRNLLI